MIKIINILSRTLCLLLMIHLLAISICDDYLLKFVSNSTIEQSLDIEEDTDDRSKNNAVEFDDKYLLSSSVYFVCHHSFHLYQNYSKTSFQYLQMALPQHIGKILLPPPRF